MATVRPSVTVTSVSILESGVKQTAFPCGNVARPGTGYDLTKLFNIGPASPVETPIRVGMSLPGEVPTAYTFNPALTDGLYVMKRGGKKQFEKETSGEVLVRDAAFLRNIVNSPRIKILTSTGGRIVELVLDPLMFDLLLEARANLHVDAVSDAFRGLILMEGQGKALDVCPGDRVALWTEPTPVRRDSQPGLSLELVEDILKECTR